MKKHTLMALVGAVLLSTSLGGCVTLTENATLSPDGSTAILAGGAPLEVGAQQPALPPPPPPPPPPKKAKIVEERIEITEKVQFAYNAAKILAVSDDLLNDVGTVMKQHPEVAKIRIEGHASSEGDDDYNKDLSERRAQAVMAFLVKVGVAEDRMEAIGYGEENPIADNETEEGREKNRRVEFNIAARLSAEELAKAKAVAAEAAADAEAAANAAADADAAQSEPETDDAETALEGN